MITEAIINIFLLLPNLLINILPEFDVSLPNDFISIGSTLFYGIAYVLPVSGLMPIFVFTLALNNFHVIWSVILRIKSFIPTMGA